jgi:hypothetical protein
LLAIPVITTILLHERYHKVFSVLNPSSSLLALQLCVGLCLLHGVHSVGFVTVKFSGIGLLAPRPTPNLEVQGLHFAWLLSLTCLAWVTLPGAHAPTSIAFRVIGVHILPLHNKVLVAEEEHINTQCYYSLFSELYTFLIPVQIKSISLEFCVSGS